MDWFMILARIVHIGAGVFWVGSAYFVFLFLSPTANALGPRAQPVMEELVKRRRMTTILPIASGLTIAAGVPLYWRDSSGFNLDWILSSTGLVFSIGALAAIFALALGASAIGPTFERMNAVGERMAGAGGPPADTDVAEMQRLQQRAGQLAVVDFVLLTTALLAMATARYF